MNRRTFFKRIAATCASVAAVAVAPAVLVAGKKALPFKPNPVQQEVLWGRVDKDVPKGWVLVQWRTGWKPWINMQDQNNVLVMAIEPIKAGQALIWNPDGTVRGA